jgi:hypothetical protein
VVGTSKAEALQKTDSTGLVLYWTDSSRVTWYLVNVELLVLQRDFHYYETFDFFGLAPRF